MNRPDPENVVLQARNLRRDAFQYRDQDYRHEEQLRFGTFKPDVPPPYNVVTQIYTTPDIHDQGMQIAAMMSTFPVPQITPPDPEDQEKCTAIVKFLSAAHAELEATSDHAWWKSNQSQIFHRIGWIKSPLKRNWYSDGPEPPKKGRDYASRLDQFHKDNTRYKKEAGVGGLFDYYHVPTDTAYCIGQVANPQGFYEIKEVELRQLILEYDLQFDERTGEIQKLPEDVTTLPAGRAQTPRFNAPNNRKLLVVEYWNRDWMMIIIENPLARWTKTKNSGKGLQYYVLDEWQHGWGRVPYFGAPAFETDSQDERYKYTSPLHALIKEAPTYNALRTMAFNLSWLGGYPSWWVETPPDAELVLDDEGRVVEHMAFRPGTFFQPARGQKVAPLPMQGAPIFEQEMQSSEKRMEQYSVASIAKGVSPGADTSNSSIAQLQRLMKSNLDPLAKNLAVQTREMYRFWLRRIKEDVGETVFAFDEENGETIPLNPKRDLVSMNVQVTVKPDVGQDQLVIEKHYSELNNLGLITDLEFHLARGKQNPEEYVLASSLDRLRKRLEQTVDQYLLAMLGQSNAVPLLIQAQQMTGDAHTGIAQVMQNFHALVQGQLPAGVGAPPQESVNAPSGMGPGAGGQPRAMGVRSPAAQTTTQPELAQNGVRMP